MPTALPPDSDFTGAGRTQGQAKAFITSMRAFLAGLLGTDGSVSAARTALSLRHENAFFPHEAAVPNMTVVIDGGTLLVNGAPVTQGQQTTSAISVPGSNSRIDRVVIDAVTAAYSVVTGTPGASPVAPAIPAGKLPVCKVGPIATATTAITNAMITDERVGVGGATPSDAQVRKATAFTTAGTAPAYTLVTSPLSTWTAGKTILDVTFHANGTTGSNTLNVDARGNLNLKQWDATGAKQPAVIASGMVSPVLYDGTDLVVLNRLPQAWSAISGKPTTLVGYGITDASPEAAESSIASAATCAIGGTASRNVYITGTTGITSFGTVAFGVVRNCRMAGALTLTRNATSLILPGGANITTALGDCFQALSLGSGNWVVRSYQKANGQPVVAGGNFVATDMNSALGVGFFFGFTNNGGAGVASLGTTAAADLTIMSGISAIGALAGTWRNIGGANVGVGSVGLFQRIA